MFPSARYVPGAVSDGSVIFPPWFLPSILWDRCYYSIVQERKMNDFPKYLGPKPRCFLVKIMQLSPIFLSYSENAKDWTNNFMSDNSVIFFS